MIPGAVTVAYLHPGEYRHCFVQSLLDLFMNDVGGAQRIVGHDRPHVVKECGSGGIVAGRNKLAETMLEGRAEWMWMVDTDMGFGPDTVERLLDAADPVDRPVVGALCFAHKTDGKASYHGTRYRCNPTLYDFAHFEDRIGFVPRAVYPADEVVPVSATGGACVLIHRTVLETIRAQYGPVWFDPITHKTGPTTFSEDLSFCVRVAGSGHPIHVHTGVKTTHDKGGVFLDEEFYDRQQQALGAS